MALPCTVPGDVVSAALSFASFNSRVWVCGKNCKLERRENKFSGFCCLINAGIAFRSIPFHSIQCSVGTGDRQQRVKQRAAHLTPALRTIQYNTVQIKGINILIAQLLCRQIVPEERAESKERQSRTLLSQELVVPYRIHSCPTVLPDLLSSLGR